MRKSTTTILGLCILGVTGGYLAENVGAIDYNSTANVGFTFNEAISLSISGDIEIEGLAAGQQKDSNSVEITVNTNSTSGYILTASVGDSTHNNSDLSLDTTNKFASVATSANLSSLTSDNTWGYKTSENNSSWSNYSGLALYSADEMSLLREANARPANGSEKTYFKIGAKASDSIVSGDYSNILTFYAVAKVPVITLADITTMQEVTSKICANTPTPLASAGKNTPQYQLIDTRDNKLYWVAKLADGNCWMTQNLDLDLSTEKTLTSADTNLPEGSSWTPDKNTVIGTALTSSTWATSSDYTHQFSWDGGNYYLPDGRDENNTACTKKDLSTCTNDVTSITSLTDASIRGNTNAHYHVGNLYTWTAAIAMNDSSSYSSSTASNYNNSPQTSICPKGWRLPNGASNGDLKKLITTTYGIASSAAGEEVLRSSPLFFARSGSVFTGSLYSVGSYGYYWSSTVYSSGNAYYLLFYSTGVGPAGNYYRYYGYAVRCIAQ